MGLWDFSVQNEMSDIVTNMTNSLNSSCHNFTTATTAASNLDVTVENTKCTNITVYNAQTTVDESCDIGLTQNAVIAQLAKLGITKSQSGITAFTGALVAGAGIQNTNSTNMTNIMNTLSESCSNEQRMTQSLQNAKIQLQNVSCGNLKVFSQNISSTSKCMLAAVNKAFVKLSTQESDTDSTHGFSFMGLILMFLLPFLVLIMIVGVGLHLFHMHAAHGIAAELHAGGATLGGLDMTQMTTRWAPPAYYPPPPPTYYPRPAAPMPAPSAAAAVLPQPMAPAPPPSAVASGAYHMDPVDKLTQQLKRMS